MGRCRHRRRHPAQRRQHRRPCPPRSRPAGPGWHDCQPDADTHPPRSA